MNSEIRVSFSVYAVPGADASEAELKPARPEITVRLKPDTT